MKNLTEFLQNEEFYSMTYEEKETLELELKEVKVNGGAKTFIYKDPEKKKSLFEKIKDALKGNNKS